MAGELATILRDQAPLGEFLLLWPFNVEATDFVSAKLKPVHVVGKVEHEVILLRVVLKKLTLRHQVLLRVFRRLAHEITLGCIDDAPTDLSFLH